jgi:hypothetical protein
MPEEVAVSFGSDAYDLCSIGDDFYEPFALADPAEALARGIAAEAAGDAACRWVRGGRSLHVFTARTGVAGFVSAARVVIGQENAIFCTSEIAEEALRACAAAGSAQPVEVLGPGVPANWRCFRGIRPTLAAPLNDCDEILLALAPHPQAAIELGGGISMSRSIWLVGHPPSIRIVGVIPAAGEVTIDGNAADCANGEWTARRWDAHGPHTICYAGLSRTYEIAPAPSSWDRWPAHEANGLTLCGVLALGPTGSTAFVSEGGFLWLIGNTPGQAVLASAQEDQALAVAMPSFPPVWAITLRTGRGRRHTAKLIGFPDPPQDPAKGVTRYAISLWCNVFRTAAQDPGLLQQQAQPGTRELWLAYRDTARALWRRTR